MTSEDWARLEALFEQARVLPAEAREACLAAACPDDALRAEVSEMLAAYDADPGFLEDGAAVTEALAGAVADGLIGHRLGPYRIAGRLGRGGQGVVYDAVRDDAEFARRVAIKVLPSWSGSAVVERFRFERRVLAALEHPGIARLIDSGATVDGAPYFVMEFVDGRPLDVWAREHRLDLAARVELVERVCDAVAFAHQHLVVHRDIKPANILVTADGQPKLLDFGIAALLADPDGADVGTTKTGHQAFTIDFASPEQIAGAPVTTASDVYSLGVLLYLLVAGRRPYAVQGLSPFEAMRTVLDGEVLPPSRVAATDSTRIRGDLDAIIGKALRKAPSERYATVAALAGDLCAWREGLPVTAAPESWARWARRFVRRHSAAAAVLAALVVGGGAAVWQARVATVERDRAAARFDDVRSLAATVIGPLHDAIADIPGSTKARQLLVSEALRYLDRLSAQASDDVGLQRELADAYLRIGDVQGNPYEANLGDHREARESVGRAVALLEHIAKAAPTSDADRLRLAHGLSSMAALSWTDGDFGAALTQYLNAAEIAGALTRRTPGDVDAALLSSRSLYGAGQALTKLGRFSEARRMYERAAVLPDAPDADTRALFDQRSAVARLKIADCLLREGRVEEAVALYSSSAGVFARLVDANPAAASLRRTWAFVLDRVALAHAVSGRLDDADRTLDAVQRLQASLLDADHDNRQARVDQAMSHGVRGGLMLLRGDVGGAAVVLNAAVAACQAFRNEGANYADLNSDCAVIVRRHGDLALQSGDPAAAYDRYRQAIAMFDAGPADAEYLPEQALVHLRASRVAVDTQVAAHLRGEAIAAWDRASANGVRTWMLEFGAPDLLARDMEAARRQNDVP